jgi:hypothetical protein
VPIYNLLYIGSERKKISLKRRRTKMRKLINFSNHSSSQWSEKQKAGWNEIVDVKFPAVDPFIDGDQFDELVAESLAKLNEYIENKDVYLMIQGEFSLCYSLYRILLENPEYNRVKLVIPTSERKLIERVKDDGTYEKTAVFEFVKWREI